MGIPCPWNITSLIHVFWYFALINPFCFGLFRGHHHSGEHSSTALSCSGASNFVPAITAFQPRCLCAMATWPLSYAVIRSFKMWCTSTRPWGSLLGPVLQLKTFFQSSRESGRPRRCCCHTKRPHRGPSSLLPSSLFSHESDSPSFHKFLFGLFGSQAKSRLWIDVVHSWFLPEVCFLGKKTNRRSRNRRCHLHR